MAIVGSARSEGYGVNIVLIIIDPGTPSDFNRLASDLGDVRVIIRQIYGIGGGG